MTSCALCPRVEEERLNTHASPLGRLCSECYDREKEARGWGPRLKSLRQVMSEPINVTVINGADCDVTMHRDGSATLHLPKEA